MLKSCTPFQEGGTTIAMSHPKNLRDLLTRTVRLLMSQQKSAHPTTIKNPYTRTLVPHRSTSTSRVRTGMDENRNFIFIHARVLLPAVRAEVETSLSSMRAYYWRYVRTGTHATSSTCPAAYHTSLQPHDLISSYCPLSYTTSDEH